MTVLGRAAASARYRAAHARKEAHSRRLAARLGGAGTGIRVAPDIQLTGADKVVLEDNVHIGAGAFVRAEGGLFVGANTHISRNLVLYTMNHDHRGARLPYDDTQVHRPVHIGRNVWIGMNVCIAPGARIGDGAIVGMGTVVAGEVPPMAIVASQPFRIVGHRDEEHYERLEGEGRYGGAGGRPLQ